MSASEAYAQIKKHTDDKIVLSLEKSFLNKNKTIKWIKNLFGVEVNQHIQIDIFKEYNKKFQKNEMIFIFTTGFIFKKIFKIKLS